MSKQKMSQFATAEQVWVLLSSLRDGILQGYIFLVNFINKYFRYGVHQGGYQGGRQGVHQSGRGRGTGLIVDGGLTPGWKTNWRDDLQPASVARQTKRFDPIASIEFADGFGQIITHCAFR